MTDERIREIFMAHGFTIKEGQTDLKPYVYEAARALLADGGKGEAVALWAAFAPEGNLLAYSKLRPGLSDILNWEPLYRTAPQADGGKGEAVDVRDELRQRGLDDHLRRIQRKEDGWKGNPDVDTAPQAECAPRAEDPDWMGKLPKCTEWPSGVAPRAEPVEESDVRPKERLCGGSHISCNGVDYCLGHPSCRDIAKERAEKDKK